MIRRTPRSKRTDTLLHDTTHFRSIHRRCGGSADRKPPQHKWDGGTRMPTRFGTGMALAGLALGLAATPAIAADTIKIAFIDPLSGMMAPIGEQGLADYRYMAERIHAAGGVAGKQLAIVPKVNNV